MCSKLIFTFWAQVLEHYIAILMVHIKHRDRHLILGEIPWDTLLFDDKQKLQNRENGRKVFLLFYIVCCF